MKRAGVLLALLLACPPLGASEVDLSRRIAPGLWELAYQRQGRIKALMLGKTEEGRSELCIRDDPRRQILDWLGRKGCVVARETLADDSYQLSGECRLKWWKSHAIPVAVTLTLGDGKTFSLDIHTLDDSFLSYVEHTQARLVTATCPEPASAAQGRQDDAVGEQHQAGKQTEIVPAP